MFIRKRFWITFTDYSDWIPQRERVTARRGKDAVKILKNLYGNVAILSIEAE